MEKNVKRVFPEDFVEYDSNFIAFDDHAVGFQVNDNDNESWTWDVVVIRDNNSLRSSFKQYPEDSAKWSFYDVYKGMCKNLGINPVEML